VAYGLAAVLGLLLVSLIGYSDKIFSVRYQLAFLALAGPAFSLVTGAVGGKAPARIAAVLLLMYALPYVLLSNMRPLVGLRPWMTRVGSVLTTDQEQLLFAIAPGYQDEYQFIADRIQEIGCSRVGLVLSGRDLEYLFWWLLDAPQSGIELRYIEAPPPLEPYLEQAYEPCAVICTSCEEVSLEGKSGVWEDYDHVKLFLAALPE